MYMEFKDVSPAPKHGVVPEFIFKPGRVTWLNLFRDHTGYVMCIATGESVDTTTRPVHHEHLVFKPDILMESYFRKMMDVGVDHHFMFGYGDHAQDLERLAELLGMPFVNLTASRSVADGQSVELKPIVRIDCKIKAWSVWVGVAV